MFKRLLIAILFLSNLIASNETVGESLPLISLFPFIGILLSIAIGPIAAPIFWHKNFGKISAMWASMFIFPFTYYFGAQEAMYNVFHVLLLEYLPFIILLLALYTISGGIRLKGTLVGTPILNTAILLIGTSLASWMGTTGAAMLLIRPLIRANNYRKYRVHTVVFFIFLVANIGGSLTPLGDPPLFLGFLNGISFFWTTKAMFFPMLLVAVILLFIYYCLDSYYYRKREYQVLTRLAHEKQFGIEGYINIMLLICVIVSVLISGFWRPSISIPSLAGVHLEFQNISRDSFLILLTIISWIYTPKNIRKENGFTWFPMQEVAKLFIGIFITIIPAISILKAGVKGKLNFLIQLLADSNGEPINSMYFWLTGILSSLLDNAPTYLVFYNIAGSNSSNTLPADHLMYNIPGTLLAISMGAVFMGAMTYIGNAPNFMVKSIAEENHIKMPSFFGYIAWSILILIPSFIIISFIFL